MHAENTFLTLTYSDENLPPDGTLVKGHLQGFHKRLHNRLLDSRGVGIRYFGVGEYGDISKRPHYHCIIFGFRFPDELIYSQGEFPIYTSKMANEVWGHGNVKIGAVSFKSAAYVARYCLKKVDGAKRAAGHYLVVGADGVVSERIPEFSHMSRRPGIGATYFERYGKEIIAHDNIVVDGKAVPSIRYYDLKIEAVDPKKFELIKKRRRRKAKFRERLVDRMLVKERLLEAVTKQKERKL